MKATIFIPSRGFLMTVMALACNLASPLIVAETPQLPGKFVWADLVTDQMTPARNFYSGLFGWKFRGQGDYQVAYNHGQPMAGILHKERPANKPKATPRWFGYLSVNDVGTAEQAVKRAGGQVVRSSGDLPHRGQQATFADPEGALFGVIHLTDGDPADATARVGDWIWLQLLSRDAHKAALFYQKVGSYQLQRNTAENRSSDYILSSEGIARATVRTIPSGKTKVQPTWLPFVRVTHLQDSLTQARSLGGKVLVSPRADLLNGKVAVVADPTGAAVGLMEWNPK